MNVFPGSTFSIAPSCFLFLFLFKPVPFTFVYPPTRKKFSISLSAIRLLLNSGETLSYATSRCVFFERTVKVLNLGLAYCSLFKVYYCNWLLVLDPSQEQVQIYSTIKAISSAGYQLLRESNKTSRSSTPEVMKSSQWGLG